MKSMRLLVLLLLAITLPARGVMAAAMLCAPHAGVQAAPAAVHADAAHGAGHAHHHEATPSGGAAPSHDGAGHDRCNLCSACCSVPPVPSAAPALPGPHETAAAAFPPFAAPAPSFLSSGPERPPRRS